MAISRSRSTALFAIIVVLLYMGFTINVPNLGPVVHFSFLLIIGGLIGISAFVFAASEIKETEGVANTLDLSLRKLFSLFLFAFFIGLGYDTLVLVVVEIFAGIANTVPQTLQISSGFMSIVVAFLIVFPLFQFYYLARPGEDSSIPAEFILEKFMEGLASVFRSPFIATLIAYGIFYVLPIYGLTYLPDVNIFTAILLWALLLPLIVLGGLAGAGLGEDLMRLRLVRNYKDIPKLGLPKLDIKNARFEIGGLFLVLFAIQALVFTFYFGIRGIGVWLSLIQETGGLIIGIFVTLILTLLNKGRGAFKELKEVWTESGFKVSVFQLFLPVFVFLGVILSSALEVFVQQSSNASGVLVALGLAQHVRLSSFFLAIQNFVLIGTAVYILKNIPNTAERRLIKEVPNFYDDDLEGYRYIYNKLKDDRSIENLIRELTSYVGKNQQHIGFLKEILSDSLSNKNKNVQIAIAEALYKIARAEDSFNKDTYEMVQNILESDSISANIYGIRSLKIMMKHLDGVEKEEALTYLQSFIGHSDPVVSWDTGLSLFRILHDEPQYRSFILAKMITTLQETEQQTTIDSISKFFNRIAKESEEIGQMAISTLGVRLVSGDGSNPENLILGTKSLLRGNPYLANDLIDQIAVGTDHPDFELRQNSYQALVNIAQYGSGDERNLVDLLLKGIKDPREQIQKIAFEALSKEVKSSPDQINRIFGIIQERYYDLEGKALIGALNVIHTMIPLTQSNDQLIFALIEDTSNSSNSHVRQTVINLLGDLVLGNNQLSETIFRIAEKNLHHENEHVRQQSVVTMGKIVTVNPRYSSIVYREVSKSREDESYIVQLAAIESLGYVASTSQQFADEIFGSLRPLLEDCDWQVRLAALNGLYSAVQSQRSLRDELVEIVKIVMKDSNRTIRAEVLDIIVWICNNYRPGVDPLLEFIVKYRKQVDIDQMVVLNNALEIIGNNYLLKIHIIIDSLRNSYMINDNNVRFSANEALKTCLEKLSASNNIDSDTKNALNRLVTQLMKAANNSSTEIRRSAYIGLTEISSAIPSLKVADRARRALNKSENMEKDVGLIEYLQEATLRAKKPLEYDLSGKIDSSK